MIDASHSASATTTPARGTYTFTEGGSTYVLTGEVRRSPWWGCDTFYPDPQFVGTLERLGYDPDAVEEDGLFLSSATFTPTAA